MYFGVCGEEVKIGTSNNPRKRIRGLQIARPDIKLLAAIPGGLETERQLHQRFQKLWITGEWFHFAPEIQEFVKEQVALNLLIRMLGQSRMRPWFVVTVTSK